MPTILILETASFRTPFAVFGAIGLLATATAAVNLCNFITSYLRPSKLHRYLHTTDSRSAWALVTGASGGLGKELAHQLAASGFNIVLHGLNKDTLDSAKDELATAHPARDIRTLVVDAVQYVSSAVLSSDEAEWLQSAIVAAVGDVNLTVLINNAGWRRRRCGFSGVL